MTRVVGVDPGLTGAVCLLHEDGIDLADMPVVDGRINPYSLVDLLAGWGRVDTVAVEAQQAYPKQGVSSSFKCGMGYGLVLGVLAALERPVTHVSASMWTRALAVGADKDAHRRRAMDLWPAHAGLFARKKDDGRADAALIARWAAQHVFAAASAS